MPMLSIVCGPAGAGKSTYARQLAVEMKACLLDSDTITEPVVKAGMALGGEDPNDRDSGVYREAFRLPVYECLYATAAENLPHVDVVLVGPFTSEIRDPHWVVKLRKQFGVGVRVIFVTCDEEVRLARIRRRGNPRDALKLRDWDSYLAESDIRPPDFECEIVRT